MRHEFNASLLQPPPDMVARGPSIML